MDALLQLLASIAAANLLDQERVDDLTARLGEVEPVEDPSGVATSDDADRTAAENAGIAALGNADPALLAEVRDALADAARNPDAPTGLVVSASEHARGIAFVERTGEESAAAEQAVIDEQIAAMEADLAPVASDTPPADPDEDPPADPPVEAVVEPEVVEPVAEPVLAAGLPATPRRAGAVGRLNRASQNRQPVPEANRAETWRLKENAGGHLMGAELDRDAMIEAFADKLNDLGGNAVGQDQFIRLASRTVEYPENRTLGRDKEENGRMIRDAIEDVRRECLEATSPEEAVARVVTAAGGICAPVEPLYDYITVGDNDRPVLNHLASFNARRGGVSWRTAPTLASLGAVNTTASGVSIWTAANDLSPSDPSTKPVFTATCPSVTSAQIYAVVARLRHGNFMGLYDPETVALWVHLQEVLQARIAETQLLTDIASNSIQVQEADIDTGFARDWLNAIDRFVTNIRYLNRMPENEPLDFLAPTWAHAALRDDRTLEIPGASSDGFTMTNAEIDSWFATRGLRVGWFRDTQYFAAQTGTVPSGGVSGPLAKYPTRIKAFISGIGHHTVLDGGSLDMGVERSPTLNDTNDTQTMSETMEKLITRGPIAYSLDQTVCVSGTTSGTASVACTS